MYYDWQMPINELTDEECGILLKSIYAYIIDGEEPKLEERSLKVIFSFMQSAFDRDAESYEKRCLANSQNGKKGGRPKAEDSKKSKSTFPPIMLPMI